MKDKCKYIFYKYIGTFPFLYLYMHVSVIHELLIPLCECLLRMERKYYYRKRNAAEKWPQHYVSIIIDGMDQG